ncbi:carbonic anhydrase 4-like [Tachyglossus aculeatus]|uniref:carbonic anhydrase 4-like n=1 Tax=Tachyglossus aculeatus TaxID=9261 RepID=UPI0018F50F8D|nr:carbonic anhydrase 4-like [Tachyglossus aculeatus]
MGEPGALRYYVNISTPGVILPNETSGRDSPLLGRLTDFLGQNGEDHSLLSICSCPGAMFQVDQCSQRICSTCHPPDPGPAAREPRPLNRTDLLYGPSIRENLGRSWPSEGSGISKCLRSPWAHPRNLPAPATFCLSYHQSDHSAAATVCGCPHCFLPTQGSGFWEITSVSPCLLPPGEFSAGMGQTRLLGLVALGLMLGASCQAHPETWCYDLPKCGPKTWPRKFCAGRSQSPVALWVDQSVPAFHSKVLKMSGYEDATLPIKVTNNGHSVNVNLRSGAWLQGGGLKGNYAVQSFHLHWGKELDIPGAEHLLEGTRASMELHVVHTKDGLPMNKAVKQKDGLAVLAFMVNVSDTNASEASWNNFTSFLDLVPEKDDEQPVIGNFSLKGLLGAVSTTSYFLYRGSLTTPLCQEVVLWAVFRQPILVSPDVVRNFTSSLFYTTASEGRRMVNNFRPLQPLGRRRVLRL